MRVEKMNSPRTLISILPGTLTNARKKNYPRLYLGKNNKIIALKRFLSTFRSAFNALRKKWTKKRVRVKYLKLRSPAANVNRGLSEPQNNMEQPDEKKQYSAQT